jgi:hypothetical protein
MNGLPYSHRNLRVLIAPALFGLVISIVFLTSSMRSMAADIGLTLPRDKVLRSCLEDKTDWCDYMVFFSYQARSVPGEEESNGKSSLRSLLPPQLAHMPFRPPAEALYSSCPIERLHVFVKRALSRSRNQLSSGAFIFDVPDYLSSCFQTTKNSLNDISFVVRDGTVNGFVSCRPDHVGIPLCSAEFARRIGGLDERMVISSFRIYEIIELFSDFPRFSENVANQQEKNLNIFLNWVGGLFGSP